MRKYTGYNHGIAGDLTQEELDACRQIGSANAYRQGPDEIVEELSRKAPDSWRIAWSGPSYNEPIVLPEIAAAGNEPILMGGVKKRRGALTYWIWAYKIIGRPPIYKEAMKQTAIRIPEHQAEWLARQPDGISATIRALIQKAMDNE